MHGIKIHKYYAARGDKVLRERLFICTALYMVTQYRYMNTNSVMSTIFPASVGIWIRLKPQSKLMHSKESFTSVFAEVQANPNISSRSIANRVQGVGIRTRQPHPQHNSAVRSKLLRHMARNREVDMASLTGCCKLLEIYSNKARVEGIRSDDIVAMCVKAAKRKFNKPKKDG